MIGNNAAAETCHRAFPNRIIRYVDFGDMVPKLPATGLLQNDYDHVQREIVLSGDGNSVQQCAAVVGCYDRVVGRRMLDEDATEGLWTELQSGLAAHLMGNYISRIADELA